MPAYMPCLAFALTVAAPVVQSADGVRDGLVIARPSPVALPAAAEVQSLEYSATPEEYEEARKDPAFAYERFTYGSDGLEVSAYLLRPAGAKQRRPLVVYIRGSWVVTGQAPHLVTIMRRMAGDGFVVVAPMLRGSDGMAGQDEMGGADRNDVKNAIAAAQALGLTDGEATFLYGQSRGGIMTLLALKDGLPVRAAATFGAITDLEAYLAADQRGAALIPKIWPDFAARRAEILTSRSALAWPERLTAPLLLMHGANDPQVDVSHTLRLAELLHRARARFAVRIFDDDGHTLRRNRVERDRTAAAFFRQFLPAAPQAPTPLAPAPR